MSLSIRRWIPVLLVWAFSLPAVGITYAGYYDCTGDRNTFLVVSDVSGLQELAPITVRLFDRDGAQLAAETLDLTTYESEVLILGELAGDAGSNAWGLVQVECETLLHLASWIRDASGWIAVNHVTRPSYEAEELGYTHYWHGIGFANTPSRKTAILLVNPSSSAVAANLRFFDPRGTQLETLEATLPAFASAYQPTGYLIEEGVDAWGLVDIRATSPILVVAEFSNAQGELIDIDLESTYYFAR